MANEKKIISRFQFRRDTTENWIANKDIKPAAGEPCYDIDLRTLKIGDGKTTYENLPVIGNSEGGNAGALQTEIAAMKAVMDVIQADIEDMEEQVGETNVVEVYENVTQLTTEMETTKAEIVTVQQTLETKADVEAVEALKTDLQTYVDEQIKAAEVTNIDDGEI